MSCEEKHGSLVCTILRVIYPGSPTQIPEAVRAALQSRFGAQETALSAEQWLIVAGIFRTHGLNNEAIRIYQHTQRITAEHFKSTREIYMQIMRDTIAGKAITLQNLNRIHEAESASATADFLTTVLDASKR